MGKFGKIILGFSIILVLVLVVLFVVGYFKPKGAGILIDTMPVSEVFIDGSSVGNTPYESIRNPGEITIKLVPEDPDLVTFETKVNLVSNIRTVIKREFGKSDDESSGEIASFEKIGGKSASVSIVSLPDFAQISIDGQVRGFSPNMINSIIPGEHKLIISSLGFNDREITIKAYEGYKLTVVVKLSKNSNLPLPSPTPSSENNLTAYKIEILKTPNNFLRVRSSPSTESEEVARVNSDSSYPLVEEDTKTGWFKIEYETGKEGWVSNEFSKKIEQ